jgi:hypothetical protein
MQRLEPDPGAGAGLVMKWQLRAAADAAGIATALGGAQPDGRRIAVRVEAGTATAWIDTSARWRGRLLWCEPARLHADERDRLAQAARAVAGEQTLTVEFDLGDEATLTGSVDLQIDGGAVVCCGEPASSTPRITGVFTRCDGATALLSGPIDLPAWTPIAIIPATDRAELRRRLAAVRLAGVPTSLGLLRACLDAAGDRTLRVRDLDAVPYAPCAVEVLAGGLHTTIQDWPGRLGTWAVGVPPSGPFDDLGFRLANRLVGNPPGAPGLEVTLAGPTLRFHASAIVALAGCSVSATLDGEPLPMWRAVAVRAGGVLRIAGPGATGARCALAVRAGFAVEPYLGSAATFDLR